VRRRDARLIIYVCKDLEAKLWIFVQDLQSAWHCVTTIFFDKILVGQQSLEIDTDMFAAGRARVARKTVAAVGDELNEIVGHGVLPGISGRRHFRVIHDCTPAGSWRGCSGARQQFREAAAAVAWRPPMTSSNELDASNRNVRFWGKSRHFQGQSGHAENEGTKVKILKREAAVQLASVTWSQELAVLN
jgi:hypothetical protein